ncbi:MAG: type III pantothenate kinase [Actinobacteria bacterium]|nr:type III pantothenate kinase [Actinomycetota bacterium]
MLLAIDVGNTNTVLGVFEDGALVASWRVKTDSRDTADELALQYRALLDGYKVTGICVCSTVPAVLREIRTMLSRYFSDIHTVIIIVVDFGTSTNLDVVSAKGEFLGGALAPGIEISLDALTSRAAQLRKVELVQPRSVIGKNTVEALQSGMIYGFAGQVDGLVRRITEELDAGPVVVVATGGLAPLVLGISETIEFHEPDLTLIGLELVFARN